MDLRLMICVSVLTFASVEAMRLPEMGRPCMYVRCPIGFETDRDCRCRPWTVQDMSPCNLMRCPLHSQCEVRGRRAVCIPDGIVLPTEPLLPNEPLPIDPIVPFDVCGLPKETGLCLAYFPRYYYNSATGTCEKFIYGGCGGNKNNFRTLLECNSNCVRTPRHSYY